MTVVLERVVVDVDVTFKVVHVKDPPVIELLPWILQVVGEYDVDEPNVKEVDVPIVNVVVFNDPVIDIVFPTISNDGMVNVPLVIDKVNLLFFIEVTDEHVIDPDLNVNDSVMNSQ